MKLRYLAALSALLGLTFFAGFAGNPQNAAHAADAPTSVQLTLDWKPEPEFGGFYAAQSAHLFQDHNLNVDIRSAGEGASTWQLVATGKTDFATTSADQVLIARQGGADVVAIFAVYQTFPQGIMVHKARGFIKIEDVFSHDGFLEAEDNPWLHFLQAKFGDGKVKIVQYGGGIADFLNKPDYSQQCFITSEPILARQNGSDPQTFLISDTGFNPYTTVVICQGNLLKKQPEKVKAMVAACRQGWAAYLKDPAPANAAMGALNKEMDAKTFAAAAEAQKPLIETSQTRKNGLGTMTADRWNTLAGQLVNLKVLDTAPKAEDCFTNP